MKRQVVGQKLRALARGGSLSAEKLRGLLAMGTVIAPLSPIAAVTCGVLWALARGIVQRKIAAKNPAAIRPVPVDGFRHVGSARRASPHGSNRLAFAALLYFAVLVLATPVYAKTQQSVGVSTGTIHVPKVQHIDVSVYTTITSTVDATVVDGWMTAGTTALKKKDSPADAACPVKLVKDGALGTFNNAGGFNFNVINSTAAYAAIRTVVSQRVAVVPSITICDDPNKPGTYSGCSAQGSPTHPVSDVVIAADQANSITLVHEFGHNVGNDDVGCSGRPPGSPSRIMYWERVSGKNEVTVPECKNYQR